MATVRLDFGSGFDVTESPADEFNISLDASEVAAAPTASAVGDASVTGAAATFANSGHQHAREAFATPAIVLGSAAAAGVATTLIRSDSTIEAFDATVPTTSAVGDVAAVGTAARAARRDHIHGREAFATPALVFTTANAIGTATTLLRSNAELAIFDTTVPVTQAFSDAAATGSAAIAARRDHRHGMPAASGPTRVRKTVTETVNNSAAVQNDDALSFSMVANAVYKIKIVMRYNSGTTPDLLVDFTGPAGASGELIGKGLSVSLGWTGNSFETFVSGSNWGGSGNNEMVIFDGLAITGGTAGTFQVRWAQDTANASDTNVLLNSYLEYERIDV